LLIDETLLEPGQLVEQGVKNVQALHSLIGSKELVAGVCAADSPLMILTANEQIMGSILLHSL
jgi:hypothetical protein